MKIERKARPVKIDKEISRRLVNLGMIQKVCCTCEYKKAIEEINRLLTKSNSTDILSGKMPEEFNPSH